MRGHAEESPEVAAKKTLEAAARRYAGTYLANPFEVGVLEAAERALVIAALGYAAAEAPAKRRPKKKA